MSMDIKKALLSFVALAIAMCPMSYIWIFKQTSVKHFRRVNVENRFNAKVNTNNRIVLSSKMGNYTFGNMVLAAIVVSMLTYELGNYPAILFFASLLLWFIIAIRLVKNIYTVIFVTDKKVYVYNYILDLYTDYLIDTNTTASVVGNILTETLAINGVCVSNGLELLNSADLALAINNAAKKCKGDINE